MAPVRHCLLGGWADALKKTAESFVSIYGIRVFYGPESTNNYTNEHYADVVSSRVSEI